MMSIETRLDGHGFLDDPKAWDADLARAIAVHLGIASLSEEHFAVLRTLRRHYRQHRAILPASQVCR